MNLKSSDKQSANLLNDYLKALPTQRLDDIVVIASGAAEASLKRLSPKLLTVSVASTKTCFIDYMLYGWSRFFPQSCKNTVMLVPPSKAHYLWGWPDEFAARMLENDTKVYLWTKHTAFYEDNDLREQGIGVITGDLSYF